MVSRHGKIPRKNAERQVKMKSMFNLSKHSMERMKSRSISYEDVQQVITRGVRSHSGCDDCYKYDYSGLRAVVTQENILVTVFRIAGEDQFVKKDSRHARALYRRRKSALREQDFLKEMRQAV